MMSLRLLVPLLETRLLCFVCSDAFIGASLFEEVTQKIAPLVAELASPERILNFVDRQMSISVLKFPPLVVGHGFNAPGASLRPRYHFVVAVRRAKKKECAA
jgi:hypothetical protein